MLHLRYPHVLATLAILSAIGTFSANAAYACAVVAFDRILPPPRSPAPGVSLLTRECGKRAYTWPGSLISGTAADERQA